MCERKDTELNGNCIIDIIKTDTGTCVKYSNGLCYQFGGVICNNANGYVAQKEVVLPVPIIVEKEFSISATKNDIENSYSGCGIVAFGCLDNSKTIRIGLQSQGGDAGLQSEHGRTVRWRIDGYWK